MPEFDNKNDFVTHIRDVTGLSSANGALSVTPEIEQNAIAEVFDSAYFKNELRNSGESEVHWDNITNIPQAGQNGNIAYVAPSSINASVNGKVGNEKLPFSTIASAINACQSGYTVVVQEDITEDFTINKSLTIKLREVVINGAITIAGATGFVYFIGTSPYLSEISSNATDAFNVVGASQLGVPQCRFENIRIRCLNNIMSDNSKGSVSLKNAWATGGNGFAGNGDFLTHESQIEVTELGSGVYRCPSIGLRITSESSWWKSRGDCVQLLGGNNPTHNFISNSTVVSTEGACVKSTSSSTSAENHIKNCVLIGVHGFQGIVWAPATIDLHMSSVEVMSSASAMKFISAGGYNADGHLQLINVVASNDLKGYAQPSAPVIDIEINTTQNIALVLSENLGKRF